MNIKYLLFALLAISAILSCNRQQQVTFSEHIAPIIHGNCSPCHRPGQAGPFSLLTYQDVFKRGEMIRYVVNDRFMPPWRADTAYRHFANERTLNQNQIDLINRWVEGGKLLGDSTKIPALPMFPDNSALGKPDMVLRMEQPFQLSGNNRDSVVFFKIPFELQSDTNVLAFEFVPGNKRAVHHSNTWVFPAEAPDEPFQAESFGPQPVTRRPPPPPFRNPQIDEGVVPPYFPAYGYLYYDGWVPGATARKWPKGFGFRMPKKGFLVLQIHYGPVSQPTEDQSSINMFFTDKPVTRPLEIVNIGTSGGISEPEPELILPPETVRSFVTKVMVNHDLSYLLLNPHMHYLGKEMKAFAITPGKDTIPLVHIPKWDFRWQEFYIPEKIIKIPQGSEIQVHATFDNTSKNPNNPKNPPVEVKAGPLTTDEMMSLIVVNVPYQPGDENISLIQN